ncbi:transglutaminase-like cysteine peptidase [Aliiglaciecola sp. 2_MG-2023]|uniref:transglutaminase-like cysteine peptidase n=1 Tax=unclassified Aliiglaciecola TaxID=2593648 RepID=UPI0026E47DCB|nr:MULTISPECIES: transglutaminase-like cysteine peptidase [unclassified Aliiglaciecola]MDO6712198.1 transglutaminase-like cysteine peptidase [Aliiglaciecola sp. 2_MG-2023]MDO6753564.1 transglutaminase-like cysteine peptidase [Aliiglaciecola sp. 1_MG-2023]
MTLFKWTICSLLIIFAFHYSAYSNINFSQKVLDSVLEKYGSDALERIINWQNLLIENQDEDIDEQLYLVNNFFNQLDFVDDDIHWGKNDYWATPLEFLGTHGGDCEDFTIAKYFSLRELGVPAKNLRLMYVKALQVNQAHMVLAYYDSPNAIPLVLDNINPRILPASKRQDLLPIYSFNGDGLWMAKAQGRGRQVQSGGNNSLWEDLTKRIEQGL